MYTGEEIKQRRAQMAQHITKGFASEPSADDIQKAKTTPEQEKKIKKVLDEFKAGKLKDFDGKKVTDRKQALAIALNEAGVEEEKDEE